MLTRREFLVAGAAMTAWRANGAGAQPSSGARPNILFILADDLGWRDLSCDGRPDYTTPVLDELAAHGVRLTQAYANSSTCSPTRVALITGRYQNRLPVGLHDPQPATATVGLPPDHPTLPGLLRTAGYRTALVSKWHMGWPPTYGPFLGPPGAGGLYDGNARVEREGYATDLFAKRAVEIVRRPDPRPFFLSLHFNAPHWPWEGPHDKPQAESLREMAHYEGGSPRVYAAMVQSLDAAIGRVLQAIDVRASNTVVVFTSDNGGERYSYHWPLRGEKGYLWEGGIRVPNMDWLPTLLPLAGARPDSAYPPDGVDLMPVLLGRSPTSERTVFWRTQDMAAARKGDWKYVRSAGDEFLVNLAEDETENANFKLKQAAIFERLKRAYQAWDKQMLPVPPEARRSPWQSIVDRARNLDPVRRP